MLCHFSVGGQTERDEALCPLVGSLSLISIKKKELHEIILLLILLLKIPYYPPSSQKIHSLF